MTAPRKRQAHGRRVRCTGGYWSYVLQALPERSQTAITVVVNWTAGLGR